MYEFFILTLYTNLTELGDTQLDVGMTKLDQISSITKLVKKQLDQIGLPKWAEKRVDQIGIEIAPIWLELTKLADILT